MIGTAASTTALRLVVASAFLAMLACEAGGGFAATANEWEYAQLEIWWEKPQGVNYYEKYHWSDPRESMTADSLEQLLGQMGIAEQELAEVRTSHLVLALGRAGSQGWELVGESIAPVTEGVGHYWMVNRNFLFKRPR